MMSLIVEYSGELNPEMYVRVMTAAQSSSHESVYDLRKCVHQMKFRCSSAEEAEEMKARVLGVAPDVQVSIG